MMVRHRPIRRGGWAFHWNPARPHPRRTGDGRRCDEECPVFRDRIQDQIRRMLPRAVERLASRQAPPIFSGAARRQRHETVRRKFGSARFRLTEKQSEQPRQMRKMPDD